MSNFLTTRQVADLLGVSAPTVIKWIEKGDLAAHRTPGGHRRVSQEALRDFSERCGGPRKGGPAKPVQGSDRICVVVVESDPDFADTVAEYLSMQGEVDVIQAIGPLDVGYAIGTHRPQVVLFDVDSPGVDVREMGRLLGAQDLGRMMGARVPVSRLFILTSMSDARLEQMVLEFKGAELIQKPVKLDRLWQLIRSG